MGEKRQTLLEKSLRMRKMSDDVIRQMFVMHNNHKGYVVIARELHCSPSYVKKVLRGESRKDIWEEFHRAERTG